MTLELDESLNIADWFLWARLAEGMSERLALIVDRMGAPVEQWTYGAIAEHADRFATALARLGVLPEQRVLLALDDGPDFVGALFGALKLGAVVVMISPELSPDEVRYLLAYSRARVMVVDAANASTITGLAEEAPLCAAVLVPGGDSAGVGLDAEVDGLPTRLASPDENGARKTVHLGDLAFGDPPPLFRTHRDDPAIWLFSGGTTGRPKAVVQTHGAFVNTTVLYGHRVLGYAPSDITLSVPKLYFGYATGSNLFFPFSVGAAALLYPEKASASRLFELIERHRPTVLIAVPTLIGRMLDAPDGEGRDLSSIRLATSAGEALPEPFFHRFRARWGVELLDGLGTAEMWHIFISNRPGAAQPGTLGQAVPGFDVEVRDDDGRVLPDGEVGWLWVRGQSRALGYVQQHDKSCDVFVGPWYRSGDMIARSPGGTFTYCGRGDDMLKVGGRWLAPKEVESCLSDHEDVEECAVVGVRDPSGLTKPVAFVRVRASRPGMADELRDWVRGRLPHFKVPRAVMLVDDFPRTHLGKIDRGRLRTTDDAVRSGSTGHHTGDNS